MENVLDMTSFENGGHLEVDSCSKVKNSTVL
jgi:hypothetical protein